MTETKVEQTQQQDEWNFENFTPLSEVQQPVQNTEAKVEPTVPQGTLEEKVEEQKETDIVIESVVEPIVEEQQPQFDLSKLLEEKTKGKFKSIEEIEAALNKQTEVKKVNILDLLKEKEEQLEAYYANKSYLKSLNNMPTEQVVKSYIKEQIPELTEVELDRYYQETYGIDENKYEDDKLGLNIAKKQQSARLNNVKQEAIQFFSKKSEQIKLPEIELEQGSVQPEFKNDVDANTVKAVTDFVDTLLSNDKSFGTLEIPVQYSNKENQVKINSKLKLDEKAISSIEEKLGSYPDYAIQRVFEKLFIKDDKWDSRGFAEFIYRALNTEKLVSAGMSEGFNRGFLHKLEKDKNVKPAQQRAASSNTPLLQPSEQEEFDSWLWGRK